MAAKAVASAAVDFTRIYTSLGLGRETITSLQLFRKRNAEAHRTRDQLSTQPTTIDFSHYRSVLKNQDIVNEAEKILAGFKPTSYDASAQIKAIEAFEIKAVSQAQATKLKVQEELNDLQATLDNIENARPFEDLSVEEVGRAHPQITQAVETMMKKGKWTVPGYKEKFGDFSVM